MKSCPYCGAEIAAEAKDCPYCGADQRTWSGRHKKLIATTFLVCMPLLGIAGALSLNTYASYQKHTAYLAKLKAQATIDAQIEQEKVSKVLAGATAAAEITVTAQARPPDPAATSVQNPPTVTAGPTHIKMCYKLNYDSASGTGECEGPPEWMPCDDQPECPN